MKQTSSAYAGLLGNPFTVVYGYDAASNRTSLTDPNNSLTTYVYDTLNRLANILHFNNNNFAFGYDALSRRTQMTRPNGPTTNYAYDSVSNLLSALHQQGANTLDGAAYAYDSAGNRTNKTNLLNNTTSNFSYDNVYQLTGVTGPNPESYTYDAVGNRLTSQSVSNYAYNNSNELTAAGTASYTYDANGNTLTKTDSTGTTTYTWDFENRLTSVQLPNSTVVAFKYDAFGRRIQKSAASTTNYAYDGANVIEEVDQSGNLLAHYNQGVGIDEPLSELRSGAVSYYEQDGLGSVTSLSGSTGSLANSYVYDAFGNVTNSTGSLINPFQYTGRDYDQESGLRYYRARYYDPATGRFLNEDSLSLGGDGPNFYTYVLNNPTSAIDPWGMQQTAPIPTTAPEPVPGNFSWLNALFGDENVHTDPWGRPYTTGIGSTLPLQPPPPAPAPGVPANLAPGSPPGKCGNNDCDNLLKEIYRYMNTIGSRITDLLIDPLDLYNLARTSPNPSLPPGSGTWIGHQQQMTGWQRGLRNLLEEAEKKGADCLPARGLWQADQYQINREGIRKMASYELDRLTMLLSADWFLPHWHLIGIFTEDGKKRCLQGGCREIVRQLMSGAQQYWDADFAPERVRETRSAFDVLLKTCKVGEAAVNRLNGLVSGAESAIDSGTRWLLVSMTEQLLDNSVTGEPPLDNAVKEALTNELKQWNGSREIDFKTLSLTSTTNWDQYLRSITPDLPAMLADYVAAIASQSKFEVLWGFINAELTPKQRRELLSWYRSVGQSLTGEPLRLAHET